MAEHDRCWHDCNNGIDSDPVVWKLEGNQVLWCAASAGLGILLFRLLHGTFDLGTLIALGLSLIPLAATTAFVLTLKTGKPPSYAAEFLEMISQSLSQWIAAHLGTEPGNPPIGAPSKINLHPLIDDDE